MAKMIMLQSSDNETFEVEEDVAVQSQTIKHMIEHGCAADTTILLPNVSGKILVKVIEYCKKHVQFNEGADDEANKITVVDHDQRLKTFDEEFVRVDKDTLFDLMLAANYLNIDSLLDLTFQTVVDMFKGMKPEQIREAFDLTPEEEEEIRMELECLGI